MSLQIAAHGGHCCGVRHIYNLPWPATLQPLPTVTVYNGLVSTAIRSASNCGLVEITVTDQQLNDNLIASLKSRGFYLVTRFSNPNTQNYVNVFHKLKGKRKNLLEDSPFNK